MKKLVLLIIACLLFTYSQSYAASSLINYIGTQPIRSGQVNGFAVEQSIDGKYYVHVKAIKGVAPFLCKIPVKTVQEARELLVLFQDKSFYQLNCAATSENKRDNSVVATAYNIHYTIAK
jgi:hypothetical protein